MRTAPHLPAWWRQGSGRSHVPEITASTWRLAVAPSSPPPAAPDVRWFSPGHQQALLDILDPARELLTLRLYRDHCCPIDASYTKDLSVFAREMPHLVLVVIEFSDVIFAVDSVPAIFGITEDGPPRPPLHLNHVHTMVLDVPLYT